MKPRGPEQLGIAQNSPAHSGTNKELHFLEDKGQGSHKDDAEDQQEPGHEKPGGQWNKTTD